MSADYYLRRCIRGSSAAPEWFECGPDEAGISLYLRVENLATAEGVLAFQLHSARGSGDLFAIWEISREILESCKLAIVPVLDDQDPVYGHLHHETRPCPSSEAAFDLAKSATPVCSYKRAKDRLP